MSDLEKYVTDLANDKDVSLDAVDSGTNLTKRERVVIQKTWEEAAKIAGGRVQVGVALFNLYFDRHPEYIAFFKAFKDIPREQLKTHSRLKAHGLNVVQTLSGVIENLEDTETAVLLLEKTGRDHVRHKLQSKQFEDLQTTTMALLQNVLGSSFTPFVKQSWNKALTVVMSVTLTSLKEEQKVQGITQ